MMDWNAMQEIYELSRSENSRTREAAQAIIVANIDEWVREYRHLPENCYQAQGKQGGPKIGDPKFENYEQVANSLMFYLTRNEGESNEQLHAREEALRSDRLGILIRLNRLSRAKQLKTTDHDFVTLFGDRYILTWWPDERRPGSPEPQEIILSYTENT